MEIIAVADLELGMFVADPDCPWTDLPFLLQGFLIDEQEQLDIFRQHCRFVSIDRARSIGKHFALPEREAPTRLDCAVSVTNSRESRRDRLLAALDDNPGLIREIERAEPVLTSLRSSLNDSFLSLHQHQKMDVVTMKEGVSEVVQSVHRHPEAAAWLTRLQKAGGYLYDHAMDVSLHMVMLGAHLGWPQDRLEVLGMAGLLQDVGKTNMPTELLERPGPLSSQEKSAMHAHVMNSFKILMDHKSDLHQDVISTVIRHHERADGSGYPKGLVGSSIGTYGEIAGLTDTYCAMTKNKPYRAGIAHQQALEQIYASRDRLFNSLLIEHFVQCVGLYPIGTLVELHTGEVAVVTTQNRTERIKPKLMLLLDSSKQVLKMPQVLDLKNDPISPDGSPYRIARGLPRNAYGISPADFFLL